METTERIRGLEGSGGLSISYIVIFYLSKPDQKMSHEGENVAIDPSRSKKAIQHGPDPKCLFIQGWIPRFTKGLHAFHSRMGSKI